MGTIRKILNIIKGLTRDTQKKMALIASSDIRVRLLDQNADLRDAAFSELTQILQDSQAAKIKPFIITTTHGAITDIQEQYTP